MYLEQARRDSGLFLLLHISELKFEFWGTTDSPSNYIIDLAAT